MSVSAGLSWLSWPGLALVLSLAWLPAQVQAQAVGSPFTTQTRYDALGRVTGTIAPDPDGTGALPALATRNTYDAAGNLTRVEAGAITTLPASTVAAAAWTGFTIEVTTEFTYDAMGRRLSQRVRGQDGVTVSLQQFGYDSLGRQVCSTVRMNPATFAAVEPDACALGPAGTKGPDRITRTVYDAAGRVLQVRKGVGTADEIADVTYSYTANGQREFVIDANGNRAQFIYDGLDSQVEWLFPAPAKPTGYDPTTPATALATAGAVNPGDRERYGYDANGNRTSLMKRDGAVLTYDYDALNRMTRKVVPERPGLDASHTRDVFYGYDLLGRLRYARFDSPAGQGVTNTWDGFGRLTASTVTMDGSWVIGHRFDANGNQTATIHPDGTTFITNYDGLDRPTLIQRLGAVAPNLVTVASYGYNTFGRRRTFGAGVNTSYGYDPAGRLNALTNTPAANAGLTNSWTFGFNPAGQIDTLSRSNDAFAFSQLYTVTRPYSTNGLNQYTAAGAASFTYDANGNLTNDGSTGFTYDVENRLVAAGGTRSAALRYDPLGRLYQVTGNAGGTRFAWDGDALLVEYSAAGTLLRRYVHGADAKADDPVAWYEGSTTSGASERILRPDWQGSIVLVTDRTGANALALNTYDEWGIPGATNQGRFQYTGQAWIPELGLYHYKARFYSPTLGRFLQVDPIGYDDQVNLYGYVGNDPVNKVDPTGMQQCVNYDSGYDVFGQNSEGLHHVKFVQTGSAQFCMGGDSNGYSGRRQGQELVGSENLSRNGQKPPSHDGGDPDYNRDLNKCRALADAGNRAAASRCYSSAERRKGLRDGGTPEDELPPLITWRMPAAPDPSGPSPWVTGGIVAGGAAVICAIAEPCGAAVLGVLGLGSLGWLSVQ